MDGPPLDAVRRSYDAVAVEYGRRMAGELAGKPLDRALLDVFAEQVSPLGAACDLGRGPGHVGAYLTGRGLDVIGVDLSLALVEQARRLLPRHQPDDVPRISSEGATPSPHVPAHRRTIGFSHRVAEAGEGWPGKRGAS